MRTATLDGRLVLVRPGPDGTDLAVDVETASDGAFPGDPQRVFERWEEFRAWAQSPAAARAPGSPIDPARLGPPSPAPRQVLAVGLNYVDHAAESGLALPDEPLVFTKFVSCLAGPEGELRLSGDTVDWEVELVVVVGRTGRDVEREDAWAHVAGLTVGQDFSDRTVQSRGGSPQFSLGKSFPGYGPTGPVLVTPDEFADPDDLAVRCTVDGEVVQDGRTRDLVFSVAELVVRLSRIVTLLPGDLIFTGTPAGVGLGRTPPRYLRPGQQVVTEIEGIGTMTQRTTT